MSSCQFNDWNGSGQHLHQGNPIMNACIASEVHSAYHSEGVFRSTSKQFTDISDQFRHENNAQQFRCTFPLVPAEVEANPPTNSCLNWGSLNDSYKSRRSNTSGSVPQHIFPQHLPNNVQITNNQQWFSSQQMSFNQPELNNATSVKYGFLGSSRTNQQTYHHYLQSQHNSNTRFGFESQRIQQNLTAPSCRFQQVHASSESHSLYNKNTNSNQGMSNSHFFNEQGLPTTSSKLRQRTFRRCTQYQSAYLHHANTFYPANQNPPSNEMPYCNPSCTNQQFLSTTSSNQPPYQAVVSNPTYQTLSCSFRRLTPPYDDGTINANTSEHFNNSGNGSEQALSNSTYLPLSPPPEITCTESSADILLSLQNRTQNSTNSFAQSTPLHPKATVRGSSVSTNYNAISNNACFSVQTSNPMKSSPVTKRRQKSTQRKAKSSTSRSDTVPSNTVSSSVNHGIENVPKLVRLSRTSSDTELTHNRHDTITTTSTVASHVSSLQTTATRGHVLPAVVETTPLSTVKVAKKAKRLNSALCYFNNSPAPLSTKPLPNTASTTNDKPIVTDLSLDKETVVSFSLKPSVGNPKSERDDPIATDLLLKKETVMCDSLKPSVENTKGERFVDSNLKETSDVSLLEDNVKTESTEDIASDFNYNKRIDVQTDEPTDELPSIKIVNYFSLSLKDDLGTPRMDSMNVDCEKPLSKATDSLNEKSKSADLQKERPASADNFPVISLPHSRPVAPTSNSRKKWCVVLFHRKKSHKTTGYEKLAEKDTDTQQTTNLSSNLCFRPNSSSAVSGFSRTSLCSSKKKPKKIGCKVRKRARISIGTPPKKLRTDLLYIATLNRLRKEDQMAQVETQDNTVSVNNNYCNINYKARHHSTDVNILNVCKPCHVLMSDLNLSLF